MKRTRILIITVSAVVLILGLGLLYSLISGPKITASPVLCFSVDDKGKPIEMAELREPYYYLFENHTQLYLSVKVNSPFVKTVRVQWYTEPFDAEHRILVDKDISISEGGYAVSVLNIPKGLTAGRYQVAVFVGDSGISEQRREFIVDYNGEKEPKE